MSRFGCFIAVFALCLFNIHYSSAACCFVPREACVYQTCGCPVTPAGIVACSSCDVCNTCNTCNTCSYKYAPSTTACSTCSSCFRDTAYPCKTCCEKPSPVCSCLASLEDCGCGRQECGCRTRIYFPEVEYPNTVLEMNPFYFATCYSF